MEHNDANNTDDVVLRVGSKTPVDSLASAVSHGVYASRPVVLRAIGPGAISQAIKAVAIARGMVAPRGFDLALVPGFVTIAMPDAEVTGIVLRVIKLP
jgi:stage V sporulation protein S